VSASVRALPSPAELQGRWVAALEEAGVRPRILEVVDRFPEERTVTVPFPTLEAVDTSLADMLLERPEELLEAGRRAMKELLPIAGPEAEGLRLRVTELPVTAHRTVREIRETDLGRFVALDAIVRKATEVRPQIKDAAFICLACKNEVHELQEEWSPVFREPLECTHCGKPQGRTRFRLLPERSVYLDSQRIEIQENPEKLKGGAHPQGLAVLLTEDLSGQVIPGNRVIVNGILRGLQRASASRGGVLRSTVFDLLLVGNSVEFQKREYSEIPITEEEERLIKSFRGDPNVLDRIVLSLAPTIKGMEEEKEAIALQLFGGVEKRHPDGIRVRGDIHCLLIGDPGCLLGDERVVLGDGTLVKLERMGSAHLQPIRTSVRVEGGRAATSVATRFHRYLRQPTLEVVTESGRSLRGTYNHPVLRSVGAGGRVEWRRLDQLEVGDRLCVARSLPCSKRTRVPTRFVIPRGAHRSSQRPVPRWYDPELAAILGYVLGAGKVGEGAVELPVPSNAPATRERLRELLLKKFGVRPTSPGPPSALYLGDALVAEWLRELRRHRVPEGILASPDPVVATFLRWYFHARSRLARPPDGAASVEVSSPHLELLRDIQALLLRWAIRAVIRGRKDGHPPSAGPPGRSRGRSWVLRVEDPDSVERFAARVGWVDRASVSSVRAPRSSRRAPEPASAPVRTETVVSIRPAGRATVYDIEVPGPKRFIANGVISHNTAKSQLLRYIADVAPRGIYTSGKGATAAGLTAAAVKDDFAGGRWVLEAGMLVLADGGMAVVDELDKMTPEDRSAMHEALEQQTVSISKAGITATLNARCPVLAAANPKFGRFTPDRTISEQIDLPPTLLSRFDVIYSIQDKPDSERDRILANRILLSHQEGESRSGVVLTELPAAIGNVPFPPDFLRKYVSWAKRHIRPVLANDALTVIEDFYVRVRKSGEEPNAPVPITARQLEALVRLSEASARARLSDVVTVADAERATRIVEGFLRRVATAEGKLDIDTVAVGMSHSQRERAELLMSIMRELQQKNGSFTLEEVKANAERQGIPPGRADALFFSYRNQGELMETRPGTWQLVRF